MSGKIPILIEELITFREELPSTLGDTALLLAHVHFALTAHIHGLIKNLYRIDSFFPQLTRDFYSGSGKYDWVNMTWTPYSLVDDTSRFSEWYKIPFYPRRGEAEAATPESFMKKLDRQPTCHHTRLK